MHRKLKRVLSGLALACIALIGGAMFGEPAPLALNESSPAIVAEADPANVELSGLWIDLQEEGMHIRIVLPLPSSEVRPVSSRHAAFQMPYFSFGSMLPRRPSES
ncbi:hypothetical protein OS176_04105 [Xanthomonadaceae bacterium XH05]|nr:hypothetical protein [Xanthomonadaceae bacterium XH05]